MEFINFIKEDGWHIFKVFVFCLLLMSFFYAFTAGYVYLILKLLRLI